MKRHIAFLRGINVSGQKIIKMEDLAKIFIDAGFPNVKTYIQSGNVLFDDPGKNPSALATKIEKMLEKALGYEVTVILRTREEIEEILALNPYKNLKLGENTKPYVTFVSDSPVNVPQLPIISPKKDVEIIAVHKNTFFCLAHRLSNGRSGFPNSFIEKEFKIPATTRNWNTVSKVVRL